MSLIIAGRRVIESHHMVDGPFEDWSKVRSPGRARRRRWRHRQNIRIYYTPKPELLMTADMIVGHPTTIARLLREARARAPRPRNDLLHAICYGLGI